LLRVVYCTVTVDNPSDAAIDAAIVCDIHYPAFVWPSVYKVPDLGQRNKPMAHVQGDGAVISKTIGREDEVRVFGADMEPAATGLNDLGLSQTYSLSVPARSRRTVALRMAVENGGSESALRGFDDASNVRAALDATKAAYDRLHHDGFLRTPDGSINRAFDWAKINTLRVQLHYPS